MFLKVSVLLMGLSMTTAYRQQLSLKSHEKINKLHSDSMVLAEGHKDYSSTCFPIYNPQLNSITDQYEVEYNSCISAYETSNALVENYYKDARLQLESSAYSSCQSLKDCDQSSTAYNVFECAAARVCTFRE